MYICKISYESYSLVSYGKEDIRSSYYLEDVATEFHIQGLELDWVCVTWDADFRFAQKMTGNIVVSSDKNGIT